MAVATYENEMMTPTIAAAMVAKRPRWLNAYRVITYVPPLDSVSSTASMYSGASRNSSAYSPIWNPGVAYPTPATMSAPDE